MKRECGEFEESIWECARTGEELAKQVRRHVGSCRECKRALEEARRLSGTLLDAGRVADTPDCRAAVMAAISREPRLSIGTILSLSKGPAWAYACGAVLLAAVIAVGMMAHRPRNTVRSPLSVTRTAPQTIQKKLFHHEQVVNAPTVNPERKPGRIETARVAVHKTHRHHAAPEHVALIQHPTPKTHHPSPATQPRSPEPRAVAAVYVTWPEGNETADQSYSYMERNAETGETTTCSVKRSGDKVEIYIESTPGGPELPVKGSIENESKINA